MDVLLLFLTGCKTTIDSKKEVAKINNLKVFLSLSNLHDKEQFNINVVKLRKSNYGLALKTGILNCPTATIAAPLA